MEITTEKKKGIRLAQGICLIEKVNSHSAQNYPPGFVQNFLCNLPIDKRERKWYNGGRRSVGGAGIFVNRQIKQILCVTFVHFVYCAFSYNMVL